MLGGLSIYLYLTLTDLESLHTQTTETLKNAQVQLDEAQKNIASLESNLTDVSTELTEEREYNDELASDLRSEKKKNDAFEDQINDITGTVGQLDKLAKVDKELLQKYSKVFFLNEHYMPKKLVPIEKKYLYNEEKPAFMNAQIEDHFEDMLDAALEDDINIWMVSAFRSFDEQANLKGQYTTTYGSGANTFSADQGYSEHQLGTTFDFTTNDLNGGLAGFGDTPAYEWLTENAYKYGFVLSYPEENIYYVFEPWHWRFVGTELARDLHRDGEQFYGLDQREIDEYLINLFD